MDSPFGWLSGDVGWVRREDKDMMPVGKKLGLCERFGVGEYVFKCVVCGHSWRPKRKNFAVCPRCKKRVVL